MKGSLNCLHLENCWTAEIEDPIRSNGTEKFEKSSRSPGFPVPVPHRFQKLSRYLLYRLNWSSKISELILTPNRKLETPLQTRLEKLPCPTYHMCSFHFISWIFNGFWGAVPSRHSAFGVHLAAVCACLSQSSTCVGSPACLLAFCLLVVKEPQATQVFMDSNTAAGHLHPVGWPENLENHRSWVKPCDV